MKQRAFTLIEMLVAMAIVLALFGAMIVATKHLKTESQRRLTASVITVVETALEQYYENTSPKQYPPQIDSQSALESALSQTITMSAGHPAPDAFPRVAHNGAYRTIPTRQRRDRRREECRERLSNCWPV